MAHALVLGATGHIGAHVVRALLQDGHTVRAAYRRDEFLFTLDDLPVERVRVDLETGEGVDAALAGCEWVFHAAGYYPSPRGASPDEAIQRGVTSARRFIERLQHAQPARVVFTSSAATIQRVPGRAATEADVIPQPSAESRGLYSIVKLAMEREMLSAAHAGMPIVIVNPSYCMGEYDARPFSGLLILLYAKYRLPWYLDHQFNVVYTGDVGVGQVRAAARGRVGERYLLSHQNMTLRQFAHLVAKEAGVAPPRWRMPYRVASSAAAMAEGWAALTCTKPLLTREALASARCPQILDGSKAVRELGMPQTPVDEALRRAVAWFRAHRYL